LRGQAIRSDGQIIDSFSLSKKRGSQPASYLAEAYPEEWLNISSEVGPNLLGKAVAVPTNNAETPVMFSLPPVKTAGQPIALEVSLTRDSARFYELVGGPFIFSTPPPGDTNRVFWATVRATGKKTVKGPELTPPLIFQARLWGEFGETLAYGQPSRVSRTAADAFQRGPGKDIDLPTAKSFFTRKGAEQPEATPPLIRVAH
jgi:hypothetical protein